MKERMISLKCSSVFWYYAEYYNSYFIYNKYYSYINDLIKCCPVLMDHLIYYLIMSLINLGLDDEAFNLINVWNVEFKHEKSKDLVPLVKAILDEDWLKLPKYDKYDSIEDSLELLNLLVTLRDQYDEEDFINNCEKKYQLFPFLPAILAIKIRNMLNLNTNRENFEDFVEAVNGDNGRLKNWRTCYPGILQNIGLMILGFKAKRFNEVIQTQANDVHEIMGLVKTWKTLDLDFLFGGLCKVQPLLKNVPRHFALEDHSGIEKWLRIYGNLFKRFTADQDRKKLPWWFVPPGFTEKHFYIKDLNLA